MMRIAKMAKRRIMERVDMDTVGDDLGPTRFDPGLL